MPGLAFLQPALLWGLALASIPIILHLLQRRRFRVRRWAAMEFLRASIRRSSRRLRIEQWLLLLVRTLILVCVALALSRPVWHSPRWGWLGSRAAAQVVLVLDDSYSMGRRGEFGARNAEFGEGASDTPNPELQTPNSYAWARERALELVREGLTTGDQVSVVLAGEPARALIRRPTFNLKEVAEQVRGAPLSDGRTDLAGAARLSQEILRSSRAAAREVYLLTDTQAVAWQRPEVVEEWKRVAAVGRLHVISPPPARVANLAVDEVRVSDPVMPGRAAAITARLSNHGERPAQGVVVTLNADGRAVTSARADIPVDGSTEVRFEHTFPAAGPHTVVVSLPEDSLPVDDRGYAAVVARGQMRVLVLNGHPDPDPRRDAAFFLSAALAPGGVVAGDSPFEVRVLEGTSFQGEDLSLWDAVVLADVPRLEEGGRRALGGFAVEGGGVLILPGPSIVPAFYNGDLLHREPALLPARLGRVRDTGAAAPALELERVDHPALARFRNAADVDLTTARFPRYYELTPLEPTSGARVVCWFTGTQPPVVRRQAPSGSAVFSGRALEAAGQDGSAPSASGSTPSSPALAERSVGLGRVALLASPLSPEWNSLPFKPAFLPFMHSLISYLGQGPGSQRNLRVGEPLVAGVQAFRRSGVQEGQVRAGRSSGHQVIRSSGHQSWVLEGPEGERATLQATGGAGQGEGQSVRVAAMARAGLYRLRAPREGQAADTWYAVNLRTEESDLTPLSRRELEGRLRPAALRWVGPSEGLSAVVREGRQGREAWRGLLLAAMALMLCESCMAQIFGRRRSLER